MGRRKLQLKRIENKSSRQVTFSKRRTGLIKKARELAVLCDVDVALVIFSSRGKLYEFSSANSLPSILDRYRSRFEEEALAVNSVNAEGSQSKHSSLHSHAQLLQIVQRQLEGQNFEQMTVTCLVQLEKQLDAALTQTRARKTQLMMESIVTLHEKERALREEKERLESEIAALKNGTDTSGGAMATLSLLK
uniref:Flowering locus C n=1 Tax=Dimocarpus longan TaxID=128017 RepID=A0A059V6W2_9ROSI|nr:flowering locus C [Dimocarpus longan]